MPGGGLHSLSDFHFNPICVTSFQSLIGYRVNLRLLLNLLLEISYFICVILIRLAFVLFSIHVAFEEKITACLN